MHSRGNEHFQTMGINSTAEKKKESPYQCWVLKAQKRREAKFTADYAQVRKIFMMATIPSAALARGIMRRGGEGE